MERAEAGGLGVAVAAHLALLWALTLARAEDPPAPSAPMEVSFVEEVGLQSAAPAADPSQSAAPELGAPEDAAPATAEAAFPETSQRPIPDPAARAPTPQPQPQRQAARQGGTGEAQASRRRSLADELRPLGEDPPRTGADRPTGAVVSAQVRAGIDRILLESLQPCQRQTVGAPSDAPVSRVRVTLTFRRNGTIEDIGTEVLTHDTSRYKQNYVDAARRVAIQCASRLRRLADEFPEYYDVRRGWRLFRYVFPPQS